MFRDINKLRVYQREWLRARRAEYFDGKCCVKCGSTEQLELDHIDRATKIHHSIWSWRKDRRLAELEKCQPLCKNCHQDKTSVENQKPLVHGNSGYDRMCRCDICKSAHSERMKKRIRKKSV